MGLIFGQQNAYSAPWLAARLGQSVTIGIEDFPHVAALRGDHALFLDYLAHSWRAARPTVNTKEGRKEHLAWLLSRPSLEGPLSIVTRPDGEQMIVDGNHRAALAFVDGNPVETVEAEDWLTAVTRVDERYGSAPGVPYQSVYAGEEIIKGRRRDTLTRHELLDVRDLIGSVLDIGCNLGASSFLAANTATRTLGVDASPALITAANRIGAYLSSPARFLVADVEKERLRGWDTILCFSVLAHVVDRRALRATLTSARVVYIEENVGRHEFRAVRPWFRHVDRITGGTRLLYRCEP